MRQIQNSQLLSLKSAGVNQDDIIGVFLIEYEVNHFCEIGLYVQQDEG